MKCPWCKRKIKVEETDNPHCRYNFLDDYDYYHEAYKCGRCGKYYFVEITEDKNYVLIRDDGWW
jgi:DNA-directed RNA polymerase subunit RPC12/RpoP